MPQAYIGNKYESAVNLGPDRGTIGSQPTQDVRIDASTIAQKKLGVSNLQIFNDVE